MSSEHARRLDLAQADVRAADGGHDPRRRSSRWRGTSAASTGSGRPASSACARSVPTAFIQALRCVIITPLGRDGRAAGVVDGQQVASRRSAGASNARRGAGDAAPRSRASPSRGAFERDEVLDAPAARSRMRVDRVEVVGVRRRRPWRRCDR